MPNIFKHFSKSKAEPYQFPDASELVPIHLEVPEPEELFPEELLPPPEPEEAPAPDPASEAINYAKVQADIILRDAHREAEELLEKARQEVHQEAEQIFAASREEGYRAGYANGLEQAALEGKRQREEQAAALEAEIQTFLEKASTSLDQHLDRNADDLRDLALSVAEKVVCISLRSSTEVISRMIQTALDKCKRREWIHIYIAECDAHRMMEIPASLTATLSALSERVRIIPMADDESGTCIIEMPDEIVDASASTQLSNIRGLLMDTPSGGTGTNLF